ncbi:MAG: DUF1735 domain-containing protein [Pedobacter sp.]|nr:MAG: DUF1735 domain-containing protein [Pedobacter sp.]
MVLLAACSKEEVRVSLPEGSVSFQQNGGKDTLQMPVSILKDSLTILELKVDLKGTTSSQEHWVNLAIDSTKLNEYRSKYGSATLLPASSYLFYKPTMRISANGSVSEPAVLNIGTQTKLMEYTTYVLPVVIKSVDGNADAAPDEVFFYVFKTGKPLFINKVGWAIAAFSSNFNTFVAANLIDANATGTYWASNITQTMPQSATINFNREVTFSAVNYTLPAILVYPTQGGYPTSIKIETSMNGTTWVDKGTFAGNINAADKKQTLNTGVTTARYLRFTSLAAIKYANTYDAIFISDISLVP